MPRHQLRQDENELHQRPRYRCCKGRWTALKQRAIPLISSESRQGFTAIGNGENMSVRPYDRVSDGKISYGPLDWTQIGRQASGRGGRHFGLNGEG